MFTILDEVCKPTKGSKYSACVDLYAREEVIINAGETVKVPLGVCIDLDIAKLDYAISSDDNIKQREERRLSYLDYFKSTHYLELHPRSSLALKGLICNIGIIDIDYKDEICLIVHNPVLLHRFVENGENYTVIEENGDTVYTIKKGQKIAQIMLKEHKTALFGIESDVERVGGFGSTGE